MAVKWYSLNHGVVVCEWLNHPFGRFLSVPGKWGLFVTHWMPLPEPPEEVKP